MIPDDRKDLKVLVIGGGGREHAICWKLAQSASVSKIFCAPGNGGTAREAKTSNVDLKVMDFDALSTFAKAQAVDLIVIGPDDPLAHGAVDHFEARGLRTFGPTKAAARLESSKAFAKNFMVKHRLPTARYLVFDNLNEALNSVHEHPWARVIKVDGLALGKGVFVCDSVEEAVAALHAIFKEQRFGQAGKRVVIEERLTGNELSLLMFSDGKHLSAMPPSRDHKRRLDGDKGPNTGGMGAYSPVDLYRSCRAEIEAQVIEPLELALRTRQLEFKGVLYVGLMIVSREMDEGKTAHQPYVLEFNARFGDPETQALLPLLQSDLLPVLWACTEGKLAGLPIEWLRAASCCVVAAADNYPESGSKDEQVSLPDKLPADVHIFQAGTKLEAGKLRTNGGRVLAVTGIGSNLEEAGRKAYGTLSAISFLGMSYRKDIAGGAVPACLSL